MSDLRRTFTQRNPWSDQILEDWRKREAAMSRAAKIRRKTTRAASTVELIAQSSP